MLLPRGIAAMAPQAAALAGQGDAASFRAISQLAWNLRDTLHFDWLVPALRGRLQQDGLVASVSAVTTILQLLPVHCTAPLAQNQLAWARAATLELASWLVSLATH